MKGKGCFVHIKKHGRWNGSSCSYSSVFLGGGELLSIFPFTTPHTLMPSASSEVPSPISYSLTIGMVMVTEDLCWSVPGLRGGPARNCHRGHYLHLQYLPKPLGLTLLEETSSQVSFPSNSFYLCLVYGPSPQIKLVGELLLITAHAQQILLANLRGAQKQKAKFWLPLRERREH